MEIYDIQIKVVEKDSKKEFSYYRDGLPIQNETLLSEEVAILEEVVQQHKKSISEDFYGKKFRFRDEEEAAEISNSLKHIDVDSIVNKNIVIVEGIRNTKLAAAHIKEYFKVETF